MGTFFRFIVIVLAVSLDISVLGRFESLFVFPGLAFSLVIAWTLILGFSESLAWTIVAGVFSDVLFFRSFGFSLLVFVVVSYVMSLFSRRMFIRHPARAIFPFCVLIFFLWGIEYGALFFFFDRGEGVQASFLLNTGWKEKGILFLANLFLFYGIYRILVRAETFLSFYTRKIRPKRYV